MVGALQASSNLAATGGVICYAIYVQDGLGIEGLKFDIPLAIGGHAAVHGVPWFLLGTLIVHLKSLWSLDGLGKLEL